MIQKMVSFLTTQGLNLRTSQVATGKDMAHILDHDQVDLLVLDLTLPDEDGLVLARQVKSRGKLPIIVLTGDTTKETLIAALELGVDDFVRKPFDPYELQLRIRNLLERSSIHLPSEKRPTKNIYRFGDYELNLDEKSLINANKGEVQLTFTEFSLIRTLAQANARPVSRGKLLDALAKGADCPTERAIDVYIRQLRTKIETVPSQPRYIETVRGFGYKLTTL